MSGIDIEHLQGWVGRERVRHDSLDPFKAQALAAALDRAELPQAGDALPAAWQWLYFVDTPRASQTGRDGHPRTGDFLPPVPLPRRMWAAGAFVIEYPLRLGEPAEQRSVVRSVELKEGKSGALVFVNVEHRTSQSGRLCLLEEQNLVYRDMPVGAAPLPPGEPVPERIDGDLSAQVQPDPVLLFRYSALTYNGHRIHYDRDYATREEHYPALVVHGPLLATLLAEQVTRHLPAARIREFRFRASRPSFDTDALTLCARRDGAQLKLWTATHEGFVGMSASATLEAGDE
jgi:3-methylfumaryl-CoA hydratase